MTDWKLSSLHRKKYGGWAGNPAGQSPRAERCCESVCGGGRGDLPHQCYRARGFGPEKAYCKQHDPAYVAAKDRAASDKYARHMEKMQVEWAAFKLFNALCQIADGHNDPRSVAIVAIKGLTRPEINRAENAE